MLVKALQETDIETRLANITARAGARDRVNIEKHLAACEAEIDPGHASLWRRLLVTMGELAPLPVHTVGTQVVQFFIADGKYRMQVFALEDNRDGLLVVYLPNVMPQAVSEKLLVKSGTRYLLARSPKEILTVEPMDVNNPADPPEYVKHMVGWNRKALKLTLRTIYPGNPQADLAESLCLLAAKQWATPAQ